MAKTVEDLEKEGLVRVGPPPIQTAEDARMAYLRGLIDEDELKAILGKFGVAFEATPLVVPSVNFDRIDDAFERTLPEAEPEKKETFEEKQERLALKEEARKAATEAAEKADESVDPNEAAKEAYDKVMAKADKKEEKAEKKPLTAPAK